MDFVWQSKDLAQLLDWLNWLIMILAILHPEITKNAVTFCKINCFAFFSKKFQTYNQNLPIDLDPILNNLGVLSFTER